MRLLNGLLDWLLKVCAYLACFVLVFMTVAITIEVILRSFFAQTMEFTDEYSGYMVLAIMALGVAYCRERNALLTVDFLIKRLGHRARLAVEFVYGLAALAFCAMLFYYVTNFWLQTIARKMKAATLQQTPLWIPQMLLPLGIGLLCLVMLRKLFRPDRYDVPTSVDGLTKE